MKIKVNIPGFGERYYSNNVEYKISSYGHYYIFYKKGTNIRHNEYGPAVEYKDGSYKYFINGRLHRLEGYAYTLYKEYYVIGKCLGITRKKFIKNIADLLIPCN